MARYSPTESTTGRAPTVRWVFSRPGGGGGKVAALELLQAAASTARARPPAAAKDTRPARLSLIMLLLANGPSNRRLCLKQVHLFRAVVYRISAARSGWGIRS